MQVDSAIHTYISLQYIMNQTKKNLPDNFNSSSTFQLFFLPLWLIPIQLIEYHHKCWNQVQVFVHPTSLQDSFWNIPLIGCPLKILRILKQAIKSIYKHLQQEKGHSRFLSINMFVIFPLTLFPLSLCFLLSHVPQQVRHQGLISEILAAKTKRFQEDWRKGQVQEHISYTAMKYCVQLKTVVSKQSHQLRFFVFASIMELCSFPIVKLIDIAS